jgi:competence protein ComGF
MERRNKEKGFTFYTLLFILTILIMCIPVQAAILKSLRDHTHYQEISTQQFFFFLQQEVIQASAITVQPTGRIVLNLENDLITFEKYGENIRRQVNRQGHEIYLRNVTALHFIEEPDGFRISITDHKGESYEKKIHLYP